MYYSSHPRGQPHTSAKFWPPAEEQNEAVVKQQEILIPELVPDLVIHSIASVFPCSSMQLSITMSEIGWRFQWDDTRGVCENRQAPENNGLGHHKWIMLPLERLSFRPVVPRKRSSTAQRRLLSGRKNCPLILKPAFGGRNKKHNIPERGAERDYRRCGRGHGAGYWQSSRPRKIKQEKQQRVCCATELPTAVGHPEHARLQHQMRKTRCHNFLLSSYLPMQ